MKETSWFSTVWKFSRKTTISDAGKPIIGIMSFEVSRLMTKIVNLWQFLTDKQISHLQQELANSLGTHNLVSDNHNYLMELALLEMIGNIKSVSKDIARIGKKCFDPVYHNLDHVFDNFGNIDINWCGWEYKLKKMEKRVKKMKKFAAVTLQLCEELEVLSDLENGLKKLQDSNSDRKKLNEFEKKVAWQREEVRSLREMSVWVPSYDYIVRLLLRSVFTIVERVKGVFVISPLTGTPAVSNFPENRCFVRCNSISTPSVYPSENLRDKPVRVFCGTHAPVKSRSLTEIGPLRRCLTSDLDSPKVNGTFQTTYIFFDPKNDKKCQKNGKNPTLGEAALSLHYANVIIFIEKLAISPRFIGQDSREDLYHMLTKTLKNSLKQKLTFFSKTDYHRDIASEWSSKMQNILDWLAPLAHNTIKRHSRTNFEKNITGSDGNVLLVNTLHYADQVKSEDAIRELVLGLHYVSRFGREINDKAFSDDYLVYQHKSTRNSEDDR